MDVAVLLILAADFGFTTLHSWQEWKGAGGPLWRNFGAIVGLEIPDAIGFPLFTVGLTLMLFAVGFIAIIGPLGHTWTAFALGALIGARLSDTLVSHVRLYVKGYRPNPGLSSTPLYLLEACFLAWLFHTRLSANSSIATVGFVIGAASFVVVLPMLRLVRLALPSLRRTPWQPGKPMPLEQ
jgi:hypothetical protein